MKPILWIVYYLLLYSKLVGRFECCVQAPCLFVFFCELPPHRSVNLVLTCIGLSVLPQATLFLPSIISFVLISFSMLWHLISLFLPCPSSAWVLSVSCFPLFLILVASCWAPSSGCKMTTNIRTNKKKRNLLPHVSALSSRLELIPRPESSEMGSFVVACCQSSCYSTPNISFPTLMTKRLV